MAATSDEGRIEESECTGWVVLRNVSHSIKPERGGSPSSIWLRTKPTHP